MQQLSEHVQSAASRSDVCGAVARVYAELQGEIDARRPVCSASGKCCRFEEYGHRLYVTTLELAAFVAGLREAGHAGAGASADRGEEIAGGTGVSLSALIRSASALPGGCPFQISGLCSVHAIRPFGCRMFFCDPTSTQWQNERYERFHAELKRLHAALDVPYFYVEWRAALAALGLSPQGKPLNLSRT